MDIETIEFYINSTLNFVWLNAEGIDSTELENTLKGTYGIDDLAKLDFTKILMNRSKKNPNRITDKTIKESIEKQALKLEIVHKIPSIDKDGNPKLNNADMDLTDSYQQFLKDINKMYEKWLILQSEIVVRQPIIDNTSAEVKAL